MDVSSQLHASAALAKGKSPWYPLDRRLDGPKCRPGRSGEEKIILLCPCQESNPARSHYSLVTILTELPPLARMGCVLESTVDCFDESYHLNRCHDCHWLTSEAFGYKYVRNSGASFVIHLSAVKRVPDVNLSHYKQTCESHSFVQRRFDSYIRR
jgi:hypothetical protein